MQYSFEDKSPVVHESVFEAPTSAIIGDVHIGECSTVWFGVVLRGDTNPIRVGSGTSIQDNVVVHHGATIGDDCTIGHCALVHGAVVGNRVLVGAGAIIFDGCEIGDDCVVGLGAVVTPNTKVPAGSMVLGLPAQVVRELRPNEIEARRSGANAYIQLGKRYRAADGFAPLKLAAKPAR